MKIGGPKGPVEIIPPAADLAEKTAKAEGPRFAELLQPQNAPLDPALPSSAFDEVSAQLKAGQIDAARAAELLVDAVIQAKGTALSPAAQDQLRTRLHQLLVGDPFLSAKLKKLSKLNEE
jgi:hypothetical protein